jgi:hypothetical protein
MEKYLAKFIAEELDLTYEMVLEILAVLPIATDAHVL